MDGPRYDLLFGKLKVGVVLQTASDFPNLWGEIVYAPALDKPKSARLRRFVKFLLLNRESTRLIDLEHEKDVAQELEAVHAELEDYKDIMESEDWYLQDASGRRVAILSPVLRGESEIVWRWDLPSQRKKPAIIPPARSGQRKDSRRRTKRGT
jgi:hypothetical protein